MHVDTHEEFAIRLLTLAPRANFTGRRVARDYSLAIWLARQYGYTYPDIHRPWSNQSSLTGSGRGHVLEFWRDDDPLARRRGEWMRNPNGDPSFPPPIAWTVNGGPGIHPPGWFPSVRLLITPEIEAELRNLDQAVGRSLDLHWFNGVPGNPPPLGPSGPVPPPPPGTWSA
ncbi:hypothetical protein [Streptacidiphilus anmyonensis]|uniref:hypothetical protein n=1 Tax=Streptacidiphilus anmyonensis TaxID=405782 RepID=UPI0005A903A1|nr:hypothetical protein [Streptacidiphilus anmyonensis]